MVNKVILLGNLGKDPVVKQLENGIAVATFSLATSERFKDKEGNVQEKTEWHNIVLWRGLAEVAEKYLHKGDKVYIEGKITTRSYEQDGVKKYLTEIVAETMKLIGGIGAKKDETTNEEKAIEISTLPLIDKDLDDLPF